MEYKRKHITALFSGLMIFALFSLVACTDKKIKQETPKAVPIKAALVNQKTVPLQITAIGNVEPFSSVAVKAQVGGELRRVHFKEGQDVNKGDMLFTIDPRPYEAALMQAEANLARDSAQLENARQEDHRYEELVKKGYVAQSQFDQIRTNYTALEAVVKADKAAIENVRLQVGYCFIRSPLTGRTGNLISYEGNLIKANADTAMVVINQIQPIYVGFSVPEKYLGEIKKRMASGKLGIDVFISPEDRSPVQGVLTFIDNTVDTATGTIKLKGTFTNQEKRLWPGQFVNIVLTLADQPNAITVPTQAVQTGQSGQYVYVIKQDQTVEMRPVVVARTFGSESIVEKGLQSGEKVVTDGHLRLVQASKVEIKGEGEGGKK